MLEIKHCAEKTLLAKVKKDNNRVGLNELIGNGNS
jgi:ribosomal protein L39E